MQAVKEYVDKQKQITSFVGNLQSSSPVLVVMDGTSIPIPCKAADHVTLAGASRVVVQRFGSEFVVMGVLA